MNAEFECDQELLIQAEFDHELDTTQSVAAQLHRRTCLRCTKVYEELRQISARLQEIPRFDAPGALRTALLKHLNPRPTALSNRHQVPKRGAQPRWPHVLAGAVGGAAAVALSVLLLAPTRPMIAELVVDSHLRAQQSQTHLLDIASTEHHVVKPWFGGRLQFTPPVKDLAMVGYPLQGARIDVIAGQSVAVLVYQAGRHSIDVFIWPSHQQPAAATSITRGFNLHHWSTNGMTLWAVSDLNSMELATFVNQWQAAAR